MGGHLTNADLIPRTGLFLNRNGGYIEPIQRRLDGVTVGARWCGNGAGDTIAYFDRDEAVIAGLKELTQYHGDHFNHVVHNGDPVSVYKAKSRVTVSRDGVITEETVGDYGLLFHLLGYQNGHR